MCKFVGLKIFWGSIIICIKQQNCYKVLVNCFADHYSVAHCGRLCIIVKIFIPCAKGRLYFLSPWHSVSCVTWFGEWHLRRSEKHHFQTEDLRTWSCFIISFSFFIIYFSFFIISFSFFFHETVFVLDRDESIRSGPRVNVR